MTNVALLKETIKKKGMLFSFIANELGMTEQVFSNKLSNGTDFKAWQMFKISDLLQLTGDEARAIFFAQNVDRESTNETIN